MAAVLDCPKCGAPINFEPGPGDKTVVCTYCSETVIIPEDLRVPLPQPANPPAASADRPWWQNWLVIAIFLIFVLYLVNMIVQAKYYAPIAKSIATADAQQVDAQLSQAQATFEAQSTQDVEATADVKATLQALQPLVNQEQNWPVLLTDNFSDTSHAWENGAVSDSYLTGSRDIAGGKYLWNVTSVDSAFVASYPKLANQSDFFVSVDLKYNQMPDDPSADAGIALRYDSENKTWYYFSVNDQGQYYFGWYDGAEWKMLIPDTTSSAYRPGETNRLSVGVQGTQFIFLINGQVVDGFNTQQQNAGNIGLGVNLPQAGQKANFEFANFTLLAPSSKP